MPADSPLTFMGSTISKATKSNVQAAKELVTGPDPKEQVKKWKSNMRREGHKIDRNIRGSCVNLRLREALHSLCPCG